MTVWNPECPLFGTEHNSHWFLDGLPNSKTHCFGWHAITREGVYVKARFHARYIRGRNSALIHRSKHDGDILFYPEDSHDASSPWYVAAYRVGRRCTRYAAPLKNPDLLTVQEVKAISEARSLLCNRCFPESGDSHD